QNRRLRSSGPGSCALLALPQGQRQFRSSSEPGCRRSRVLHRSSKPRLSVLHRRIQELGAGTESEHHSTIGSSVGAGFSPAGGLWPKRFWLKVTVQGLTRRRQSYDRRAKRHQQQYCISNCRERHVKTRRLRLCRCVFVVIAVYCKVGTYFSNELTSEFHAAATSFATNA